MLREYQRRRLGNINCRFELVGCIVWMIASLPILTFVILGDNVACQGDRRAKRHRQSPNPNTPTTSDPKITKHIRMFTVIRSMFDDPTTSSLGRDTPTLDILRYTRPHRHAPVKPLAEGDGSMKEHAVCHAFNRHNSHGESRFRSRWPTRSNHSFESTRGSGATSAPRGGVST